MKKIIIFSFLLCTILLSSCYLFVNIDFDYEQFQLKRAEWESHNVQNYSFDYYSVGFLLYDLHITVENSIVTAVTPDENSEESDGMTIDDLFQQVEDIYLYYRDENTDPSFYLTEIELEFDPVYSFITSYHSDYYISPGLAVDGNFSWRVENFQVAE